LRSVKSDFFKQHSPVTLIEQRTFQSFHTFPQYSSSWNSEKCHRPALTTANVQSAQTEPWSSYVPLFDQLIHCWNAFRLWKRFCCNSWQNEVTFKFTVSSKCHSSRF